MDPNAWRLKRSFFIYERLSNMKQYLTKLSSENIIIMYYYIYPVHIIIASDFFVLFYLRKEKL